MLGWFIISVQNTYSQGTSSNLDLVDPNDKCRGLDMGLWNYCADTLRTKSICLESGRLTVIPTLIGLGPT